MRTEGPEPAVAAEWEPVLGCNRSPRGSNKTIATRNGLSDRGSRMRLFVYRRTKKNSFASPLVTVVVSPGKPNYATRILVPPPRSWNLFHVFTGLCCGKLLAVPERSVRVRLLVFWSSRRHKFLELTRYDRLKDLFFYRASERLSLLPLSIPPGLVSSP